MANVGIDACSKIRQMGNAQVVTFPALIQDPDGRIEQALTDLVGYVFRHEVPLRRALGHIEFDFGLEVRRVVADLLISVDRKRQPRTARDLVWGAVALFVAQIERDEDAAVLDVTARDRRGADLTDADLTDADLTDAGGRVSPGL